MENDPRAEKWSWLSRNYFQWLPRAFVLAELCNRDRSDLVDRGWKAIDHTIVAWSETTANSKNGILLKRLILKASAKRDGEWSSQNWNPSTNVSMATTSKSDIGLEVDLLAQNVRFESGGVMASNLTTIPPLGTFQAGTEDTTPAQHQPTATPCSVPEIIPEMTLTSDYIYTGDWNHLVTDFGAIIRYHGKASQSYPNLGFGV